MRGLIALSAQEERNKGLGAVLVSTARMLCEDAAVMMVLTALAIEG